MHSIPRLALLLAPLVLACGATRPIVEHRVYGEADRPLGRVVVLPFQAAAEGTGEPPTDEAVALVERFATEALLARGLDVVPAQDVRTAFRRAGRRFPAGAPLSALPVAAREFGARTVLVGRVHRFRDRMPGALGRPRPASVAFELVLHAVPDGAPVWRARFDETQLALSEAPVRARQYPGGGSRWLSGAELARWGTRVAARTLRVPNEG